VVELKPLCDLKRIIVPLLQGVGKLCVLTTRQNLADKGTHVAAFAGRRGHVWQIPSYTY
jgi:hypothetical protein